jgi:DNA replication protein DnaC
VSQPDAPSIDVLRQQCKTLCLPTAYQMVEQALDTARREDWPLETFLHYMLEQELTGRRQRRAERRIKESHLPEGKTLSTFDQKRLPLRVRRLLPQLCRGEWVDRVENILIFAKGAGHREDTFGRRLGVRMDLCQS